MNIIFDQLKTGLAHHPRQKSFVVVGCLFHSSHEQRNDPGPEIARLAQVGQVKLPSRSQDPVYFIQCSLLVVLGQVVKEKTGKDPVEGFIRVR